MSTPNLALPRSSRRLVSTSRRDAFFGAGADDDLHSCNSGKGEQHWVERMQNEIKIRNRMFRTRCLSVAGDSVAQRQRMDAAHYAHVQREI